MIATNAIPPAIHKLHLLVFMPGLRSAFFRRQRVVIDAPERPDKSIEDVRGRRDDVLLKPEVAGFVGEGYASFFDGTLETYEGGARGVEVT